MDPVTAIQLVASLVSLIKACRTSLQAIKDFKRGDDDFAEFVGDIETFVAFVQGLERILQHRQRQDGNWLSKDLQVALEGAHRTVAKLDTKLKRVKTADISAIRRIKWLQSRAELQKLRCRIRDHNLSLNGFVLLFCVGGFMLECDSDPKLLQFCASVQDEEGDVDLVMDLPIETSPTIIEAQLAPPSPSARSTSPFGGPVYAPERQPGIGSRRRSCTFDCYCSCHSDDGDDMPSFRLKRSITGLSQLTRTRRKCSEPTCQRSFRPHANKLVLPSSTFRKALATLVSSRGWRRKHHLHTYRLVPETTDAMRYAKHGNLGALMALIESGEATPFDTGPTGWSLLHRAAYWGQLNIVRFLYKIGADTDVGEVGSRRPVDFAILRALAIDATDVQRQIMETFPAHQTYRLDFGFSPIHVAVLDLYDMTDTTRPNLEDLIKFVDDANNAPPGNDWSAWRRKLVEASPLYADIVEMFCEKSTKSNMQKTILDVINEPDDKWGWPPFHWAAFTGRRDKMEILIRNNADPFKLSPMKRNTIHIAAESKRPDVLSYILDISAANKGKLDVNKADRWKETPLHIAASGSAVCVQLLLDRGADPNARQENQQIPLHYTSICTDEEEKFRIVSLLSRPGVCSINARDEDGRTPLFEHLDSPACIQVLVEHGADLTITDETGNTAIHVACIDNESESLRKLLALTSDPRAVARLNAKGNTPLLEACVHNSKDSVAVMLEQADTNCSMAGEDGRFPVHYAAKWGNEIILEAVLTHPTFTRGQKISDGSSAAMEAYKACKWNGRVKELLKKYDSIAGCVTPSDDFITFGESAAVNLSLR